MKRYSPTSFARKFHRKPHIAYHAPRYAQLLDVLARYRSSAGAETRVLDVGRSPLTEILYDEMMVPVDSLGTIGPGPSADADRGFGQHYAFDLARASDRQRWRTDLPAYDVIVAAQAYDYPHDLAARDLLACLATLLKPGGVLVVQSPNPRALHHRARSLLGKPAAGRGFDLRELRSAAQDLGLEVAESSYTRGFDLRYHARLRKRRRLGSAANLAFLLTPAPLKPAYTFVFRRTNSP